MLGVIQVLCAIVCTTMLGIDSLFNYIGKNVGINDLPLLCSCSDSV